MLGVDVGEEILEECLVNSVTGIYRCALVCHQYHDTVSLRCAWGMSGKPPKAASSSPRASGLRWRHRYTSIVGVHVDRSSSNLQLASPLASLLQEARCGLWVCSAAALAHGRHGETLQ